MAWRLKCLLVMGAITLHSALHAEAESIPLRLQAMSFYEPAPSIRLQHFAQRLERHRAKDDHVFLKKVFSDVHARYLRSYDEAATFEKTLTSGEYNCLTATALYGIILEHFGFHFSIFETPSHAYLIVFTTSGEVLFESTDPVNGMVVGKKEIKQVLAERQRALNSERAYGFRNESWNQVSLDQLPALLRYNNAVRYYNEGYFDQSLAEVERAYQQYSSPRISEFLKILGKAIAHSDLSFETRYEMMSRLQKLKAARQSLSASSQH